MFIIRKDLWDQGITTLEKLTEWKRPDGRKPIVSVSSLGGTNHVWSSYYMETMGLAEKVTWIGTGNVDTMLGSLKTKQVDVLVSSLSLLDESQQQGWGTLAVRRHGRGDLEQIYRRQGAGDGTFHGTVDDRQGPAQDAGLRHRAMARGALWIKAHSPDEVYDTIEPYVGSTSREANVLEITALKKVADYDGVVDAASFARGEKVWFREMTGIKPLTIAEVVRPEFAQRARRRRIRVEVPVPKPRDSRAQGTPNAARPIAGCAAGSTSGA